MRAASSHANAAHARIAATDRAAPGRPPATAVIAAATPSGARTRTSDADLRTPARSATAPSPPAKRSACCRQKAPCRRAAAASNAVKPGSATRARLAVKRRAPMACAIVDMMPQGEFGVAGTASWVVPLRERDE